MSHKNNISNSKEHSPESDSVVVRVVNESEEGLDTTVDGVGERVSEVASEKASEQGSGGQAKTQQSAKNQKQQKEKLLNEHLMLRERLLAAAPKSPEMRKEVKAILEVRKNKVEKDIRKLSRSQNYELLSKAIAELRHVVHQIQLVTHAGYEILKEIWLRVVHQFA